MPTVIHVSPHPDDESIAVPCTLLSLQEAGWKVVNFAAGLGRKVDHDRRDGELQKALDTAGFLDVRSPTMPGLSRGDDLGAACRTLTGQIADVVRQYGAELVVGPHPRDGHHGHATVARAIRQMIWEAQEPPTWWMWPLWTDLVRPTLMVDCSTKHLETAGRMLGAYEVENERNDYRKLLESMRVVNAVRGVERVFGYGSASAEHARDITHAELLTEVTVRSTWRGRQWMEGGRRVLDPEVPATTWTPMRDHSILSSTRLRPFYRPVALSVFARHRFPFLTVRGPRDERPHR